MLGYGDAGERDFSEGTAGGLDLHGSFFNDRSPSSRSGGASLNTPCPPPRDPHPGA